MSEGKIGQRVRLISAASPNAGAKPGDTGVIWHIVPSNGFLRVKWDSGARLDLNPRKDQWEVID
jgi:hypothetical protein